MNTSVAAKIQSQLLPIFNLHHKICEAPILMIYVRVLKDTPCPKNSPALLISLSWISTVLSLKLKADAQQMFTSARTADLCALDIPPSDLTKSCKINKKLE